MRLALRQALVDQRRGGGQGQEPRRVADQPGAQELVRVDAEVPELLGQPRPPAHLEVVAGLQQRPRPPALAAVHQARMAAVAEA